MNVLIIDDNEMTRTLLRTILSGKGHVIVGETGSGRQGMEQALRLKPDLVCLDIHMPDADGIDILRKLAAKLPRTAVLMVTGKRDPETARECMANGAKGVIVKPFNAAAVLAAVDGAGKQVVTTLSSAAARRTRSSASQPTFFGLANIKIGTRLGLGFGVMMVLIFLTCAAGNWALGIAGAASKQVVEQSFGKERLVAEWRGATNLNGARTMAIAKNADPAEQAALGAKIKETSSRISDIQKQLDGFSKNASEVAMYEEIATKRKDYIAARDEVFAIKKEGDEDKAKARTSERLEPALMQYVAAIDKLAEYQLKDIALSETHLEEQFSFGKFMLYILTGLALVFGVAFAYFITLSIIRPLRAAIDVSSAVSRGDLTTAGVAVGGSDELSELLWGLKHMSENLGVLVGRVRAGADLIATASGQIAKGSLNLSVRTEQQAASLEETASTMEELTSTVKQNADNAFQANRLAESASDVATKGGTVVAQVVDTMGSINESSKKIADIIGVIDGIAFQTNILALNAAVEAARAGEQGRGFAVVAAEVRNLAQRSAAAAKEIKSLIDTSVDKVDIGGQLVGQAGARMGEIVSSIKEVTDVVGDITTASREQSSGIEQVSDSITSLDQMTQQNAILVEQSLEAAQSLENQARELVEIVSVFTLDRAHDNPAGMKAKAPKVIAESRGTAKEAIALVKRAVAYRKGCATRQTFLGGLTDRANKFFDRDMYVFALDDAGQYLAFGGNPAKVGTKVQDIAGIDGAALMKAIIAQGKQGPGWVEYDIVNPTTNQVQSKMSYIEVVEGIYLGCGVYRAV